MTGSQESFPLPRSARGILASLEWEVLVRAELVAIAAIVAGLTTAHGAQVAPNRGTALQPTNLAIASVPDAIVYEVFLRAVHSWDQRAADSAVRSERRDGLRKRMQDVSGLNDQTYEAVRALAYAFVEALDRNAKEADQISRATELAVEARREKLTKIQAQRQVEIASAIRQLQVTIGAAFPEFDMRVRQHVVPRLRIQEASGSQPK